MGDESHYAYDSKFMIGFVPSAQQQTLQSSKVQNCQNWGQLWEGPTMGLKIMKAYKSKKFKYEIHSYLLHN